MNLLEYLAGRDERRCGLASERAKLVHASPETGVLLQHKQVFRLATILIVAIVVIGGAPVIMTGLIGKSIPEALIATSDKTVTGLIGVLGTIAGLIVRSKVAGDGRQ